MSQIKYINTERTPDLEIWEIWVNNTHAFTVRFELWSMLTQTYYAKFIPVNVDVLTLGILRSLQKRFSLVQAHVIAQCETQAHQRFVSFFGFNPTLFLPGITQMELNQCN